MNTHIARIPRPRVYGAGWRRFRVFTMTLGALLASSAIGYANERAGERATLTPLPRDLEIQLALSTLPRHLRDSATVYVLNPAHGFEVARRGTNGFHAFVARTGDDAFSGSWPLTAYRDDILYPISFDAAGAKENMREFFDAAEMQAKGMPPQELKKLIQQRFASHYYKAPERAGLSYMMSPILRTYTNPDNDETVATTIVPHVMHFVPNVSGEDVGAATPAPAAMEHFKVHGEWEHNPDPFVIHKGPHGYLVQFLGVSERAAIRKEYSGMLDRLCRIKKEWCLPSE
jgi:hypothetical protein